MNLLAYLNSKVWAIETREMNKLLMKAAQDNPDMSKLAADFEARKAQLAKAPLGSGMRTRLKTGAIQENGVAIINISGPIFNVEGYFDEIIAYYFGGTSYQALQSDIETIANDGQVKAWGVYAHSGGGEAFGMTETANKFAALTKQKPSIGYAYGLACSATFGLISGTGKIVADASAWIGSVGVVTQWADFTGFYEKLGIAYEEVTSTNAPFKRLDIRKPEHRAKLMEEIDGVENEFVKLLAKNFGVSVEKVRSDFGQGAVMTAKPAKAAGMIHEIGSWANVLSELQKIARKAGETNALGADITGELEMGLKDDVKALAIKLGLKVADETPENSVENEETQPDAGNGNDDLSAKLTASEQREKELQAKLEELNGKAEEEKKANLAKDADNFALAEIKAGRLFSAEKETFIANYLQAAADDDASPLATGSRVGALKALQEKRAPHGLTEELLEASGSFTTLPINESEEAKMKADVEKQAGEYASTMSGGLSIVK